jgi:transcriptional regulator with XRE-family HTH domain
MRVGQRHPYDLAPMTPRDEGAYWDSQLFEQQLGALGERVRDARQSRAWSQQDLSNRTDIHRANISRIESGKKNLTLAVLWRLASTLEVHWADLLDDRVADLPEAPYTSAPFEEQLDAFGTRAYQTRALQRLTQQTLADQTGIGRSTISWIEDGTKNVTLESLSRLAAGLRVHWADLLDDRRDRPPQPARMRRPN